MAASSSAEVRIGKTWKLMLSDLGLSEERVLTQAGLPPDLLGSAGTTVPLDDYYRLCTVLEGASEDPGLALRLGERATVEYVAPAFFAAMCSPDMNTAARRMGAYKSLVGPFALDVDVSTARTTIVMRCKHRPDVPALVARTEMVFLTAFVRRATRHRVCPVRVELCDPCPDPDRYRAWFGCPVGLGDRPALTLSRRDAARPFLTHDDALWASFQPSLCRRMELAQAEASTRARVEQVLRELLPSARATMPEAASELAMSRRTLQRRLAEEGTTWSEVVDDTRRRLAQHYLVSTTMAPAEIGFLLGYESSSSLFRAFRRWTGTSPEAWRANNQRESMAEGA